MGSNAKRITVNCGTTHVSVSVFSEKSGGLVLEKLLVEDLVYNYTEEDEWERIAARALREVFSTLKIKGAARVIAPGHLLLTKNVKVPQVEKSRQQQIIAFEAREKFPFKLDELVWDSQTISSDGVEAEVVLFAIKRENADRFANAMIAGAGITPAIIQPSTNLDYQAYRFLNPNDSENVLIVNVGARTTNLTFVFPEGFGIQNIAVGGNRLTQKIADSMGKSFQAAERLKVSYFSGAMDVAEGDPHAAVLQSCAQDFCRRLSQEITRRIVNQKRQNADGVPTKILLTGRGALLPGLSEALAESQRIPVDYFDPASVVQCGPGVDPGYIDSCRYQLSEVIGDASEMLNSAFCRVNLLPHQIASDIEFSKKKPFVVAAALLFALTPWPIFFYLNASGDMIAEQARDLKKQDRVLQDRKKTLLALRSESAPLRVYVDKFSDSLDTRDRWNAFLTDLQETLNTLQVPVVVDEEKTYKNDRHVWIESMSVVRKVRKSAETEGTESSAPEKISEVRIGFCMLVPEVDGMKPEHNSAAFEARRKALLDALKKSDSVATISGERPDLSQPNLPRLTLTLVLKSEKGI